MGAQFRDMSEGEHNERILKRYKGETDPKEALFKAIMEKTLVIEEAMESEQPLKIFKPARTSLFIIEHVTAETLIKCLKTKDPDSKPTAAALEKISDCVIDKLPDESFFSKGGDDGAADKKRAAKRWLERIEADDRYEETECYEATLYLHALCIEYLRRVGDLTRSSQLSCATSRDNRFLSMDDNGFRPTLSETSGGVCCTAMFSY